MSDKHPGCSGGRQHFTRYFASIGPFARPENVLPADANNGFFRRLNSGGDADADWEDDYFTTNRIVQQRRELLKESRGFLGVLVHLPIGRHDATSHKVERFRCPFCRSKRKLVPAAIDVPKFWATVWPISASVERVPRLTPPSMVVP